MPSAERLEDTRETRALLESKFVFLASVATVKAAEALTAL